MPRQNANFTKLYLLFPKEIHDLTTASAFPALLHLIFSSLSTSLRLMVSTLVTPCSCMVTP